MSLSTVANVAAAMVLEDRLRLIEAVAESISQAETSCELTNDLKQEIDRRIVEMEANPDDEVLWEQAKAEIQASLRQ